MKFLLCLLVLVACENPLNPLDPVMTQIRPFDPPPSYRVWYESLVECSGRTGDFDAIRFFTVGNVVVNGVEREGVWLRDGNKILLRADATAYVGLVKHEEMHALLQTGEHPVRYFNGVCGDLMNSW